MLFQRLLPDNNWSDNSPGQHLCYPQPAGIGMLAFTAQTTIVYFISLSKIIKL